MAPDGSSTLPGLLLQFESAARAVTASVEYIERSGEAVRDAVFRKAGGEAPIVVAAPSRLPAAYFAPLIAAPGVLNTPTVEEFRNAPVGVCEAFAGVARTGSVCVEISAGMNGFASLIPRLHIALVEADKIVPQPRDVITSETGLQSDYVFVTGPSATADMGPLVRGVHGPHKLHILVLR